MRYNVAAQMVPLCEALGPEMTRAELVPAYTKLLEDTEAEVRIAAAGKVSAFSRMLTPQLIVSQVGLATPLAWEARATSWDLVQQGSWCWCWYV